MVANETQRVLRSRYRTLVTQIYQLKPDFCDDAANFKRRE